MRRTAHATVAAAAVALAVVLHASRGRLQWWTSEGPLALPALHPADRALIKAAEAVIEAA